ncbi:MAG: M3 family oligoendopeptidase [Chloroflexota bacterium]|nr:M3 family oligoendopeptidase [Chloroflexota bacterium]
MVQTAPTPETFADATWDDIAPWFRELADRPLDPGDTAGIEQWIADWSALESALFEAQARANVAYSIDTSDPEKEATHLRFSRDIGPRRNEASVQLANRLLDTGYSRGDLDVTLRKFRTNRDLFREENIPLEQELQGLSARYSKVTGGMTVEWDGKEIPIPQLAKYLLSPDRDTRERAFRLQFAPYIAERDTLADIFDEMLRLRQQVARNAGYENYLDYTFDAKHRYSYTAEDCLAWHDAVRQTFVPAVGRRLERRKELMGVDTLRPWDTGQDPLGRPPLQPYDDPAELPGTAATIFGNVDPVFGEQFHAMIDGGLLDLESRTGKRPGGFCTTYPVTERPFIFMNASGVARDVRTMLHEAGHAFHSYAAFNLPYLFQRHPGSEMAEVASMSMELLAAPSLHKREGGYYDDEDYQRARIDHLEGILDLFPWVATVDAFQHWLYTSPDADDRDARDAYWLELWAQFDPHTDWSGLEAERTARWHKQLHIFQYPFYYIEYGIAQLGALQVWRNSLEDHERAVEDYRQALALGGTKPLPELFEAAGARLIFDAEGMGELVGLVEQEIAELEA